MDGLEKRVRFCLVPLSWLGEQSDTVTLGKRRKLVYPDQGQSESEVQYRIHGTSLIDKVSSDGKGTITYYYDKRGFSLPVNKMDPAVQAEKARIDRAWSVELQEGEVR
mgnify:FL=1